MAKIHVLESNVDGSFRVVLHTPVPAGNNSAGKSWKDSLLNSGRSGSTILPEGPGPGQITTAEKADVEAGDVIEIIDTLKVDPRISGAPLVALVEQLADEAIAEYFARLARELKYFGYTQN